MNVVVVGEEAAAVADGHGLKGLDEVAVSSFESVSAATAAMDVDSVAAAVPVGEAALLDVVRAEIDVPVVPIEIGQGVTDIERSDLGAALRSLPDESHSRMAVPTIDVRGRAEQYRALMDVMAVTGEAAKISEYQITSGSGESAEMLDRVRADGILAAAPAGTPGYGTAAGGPLLDPNLEAVTVIPVGPFRVEQPHWVLELPVSLRVVREEVPVSLLVDDREVGSLEPGTTVDLSWGRPLTVLETPVSRSPLAGSPATAEE